MEAKDWLPIIGWVVTFVLGLLSGGLIVPRLTRKRKVIEWAVVAENEIIPRELSAVLGVPVVLQVGTERPNSLSVVHIRLGGGGNEIVENVKLKIAFNPTARILNVRPLDDLGEYASHVTWSIDKSICSFSFAFLNPRQTVDFELLLNEYEIHSAAVDAAAPGLELRRRDPTRWEVPASVFRAFGLSLVGIRYDPAALSMREIADELKAIRRSFRKE